MKKTLVLVLVLVVVLTGLPILMGMPGMTMCDECGPAVVFHGECLLAIVAVGLALALARLRGQVRPRADEMRDLLLGATLDRPPRFA